MGQMRALFIVNPAAGAKRALARWKLFEGQLRQGQPDLDRVFTTGPGDATLLARKAAANYDLLIAVGGDGTVAEVASGILSSGRNGTALGILPLGTGNDVATVLGIPSNVGGLKDFAKMRSQQIDVIQIDCQQDDRPVVRYALLFAGVGIISESLRRTTPFLKTIFGQRLAYPAGLVQALCTYRSPPMTVNFGENPVQDHFLFVGASNTEIAGGGMKVAPEAKVDDALLNINLIRQVNRWQALILLRRLCQGRHTDHPKVRYLTARILEITAPTNLEVAADGDLVGRTPARFTVKAKALRVVGGFWNSNDDSGVGGGRLHIGETD